MENVETKIQATDDELDSKIGELSQKEDRTEDDSKQLDSLKSEKHTRVQKRIDALTWRSKSAEEERDEERKKNEALKARLTSLEADKPKDAPIIKKETIEADGQTFYTDETLRSMIDSGRLTDNEAYDHQQKRLVSQASDRAYKRIKGEYEQTTIQKERDSDIMSVLQSNPNFAQKLNDGSRNPDFDATDPLYKEWISLYQGGLHTNSKGATLALAKAKRIVGVTGKHVDVSDNLNLHSSGASREAPRPSDDEEVTLNDDQKEMAVRMYRDQKNPKTNRTFTDLEAIEKYKRAINNRRASWKT